MDAVWAPVVTVAAILVCYIVLAVIFTLKPSWLHAKANLMKFSGRHVSHRGGGGEELENTLTAIRKAFQVGSDIIEIDVRLSQDGEVVVFHDETFLRTCGVDVAIADTEYKEFPSLQPPLGIYYMKCHLTPGGPDRRIRKIREIFDEFPENPIMIEVKCYDVELIHKLSVLVKEYDRERITTWGSFDTKTSDKLYEINPEIPLYFNQFRGTMIVVLFYLGLLPFCPLKESALLAPMPSIELDPANGFEHTLVEKVKLWIKDKILMRAALFTHLKKRGIPTYLYTLNKDCDFERAFFDLGVTGVLTDFPKVLKDYLDRAMP